MGLVKCPDCARDISALSASCIHCGCPTPKPPPPPKQAPPKTFPPGPALTALGACLLGAGVVGLIVGQAGYAAWTMGAGLASVSVGALVRWLSEK